MLTTMRRRLSFHDLVIRLRVLLQGLTDIPIFSVLSHWNLFVLSISILPVLTSKDPLADNLSPLERAAGRELMVLDTKVKLQDLWLQLLKLGSTNDPRLEPMKIKLITMKVLHLHNQSSLVSFQKREFHEYRVRRTPLATIL